MSGWASLSDVAETWWDAGGIFACPDTDPFSARCQNREGHSPLAIHTAEFLHVLVQLAAGLALCYGETNNLTCFPSQRRPKTAIFYVAMLTLTSVSSASAAGPSLASTRGRARA